MKSLSLALSLPLSGFLKCQGRKNSKPSLPPLPPPPPPLPAYFSLEKKGLVGVFCGGGKVADGNTEAASKIGEISSLESALQTRHCCKVSWRLFGYLQGGQRVKTCSHVAFPADWVLQLWDWSQPGLPWRGAEPVLCRLHEGGHRHRLVTAWVYLCVEYIQREMYRWKQGMPVRSVVLVSI